MTQNTHYVCITKTTGLNFGIRWETTSAIQKALEMVNTHRKT